MTAPRPRILFLHRHQAAQFEFLARWLAGNGWDVTFAHVGETSDHTTPEGIRVLRFPVAPDERPQNDFRHSLEHAAQTALGASRAFLWLRDQEGYEPDVVVAHVGWGVGLGVRQVWPRTRYVAYHEWFYTDVDWDRDRRERPNSLLGMITNRLRNLPISAEFDSADANWCPTGFQASRFPPQLRDQITVIPDGVDCTLHAPDPAACIDFDWLSLPPGTKVLTYATRGMEPVRGFPQFMRAVEILQRRRDDFHTVVLAQDSVSYGPQLPEGDSWQKRALAALDLDLSNLHIHEMKPRAEYLRVLQASTAHVYFTEPFVTSWSLSEALATGALVIGSNTAPVEELIEDMQNGILVDMDDPEETADMVEWVFDYPEEAAKIRGCARAEILHKQDAQNVFAEKDRILRALIAADRN